jgi:hypothetical protein
MIFKKYLRINLMKKQIKNKQINLQIMQITNLFPTLKKKL